MTIDEIARYSVTETIRDQREVTIRAVRPDDKAMVVETFHEASAESIYRRLFEVRKELTDQELKLVTEVDFVDVVQLVALLEKDGKEHIVGGGRYMRTTGQKAEVACLVDDEFQGMGIAPKIIKHLVAIARASDITHFEAEVLPSNEAMLKVFERSGVCVTTAPSEGYVYVLMDLR